MLTIIIYPPTHLPYPTVVAADCVMGLPPLRPLRPRPPLLLETTKSGYGFRHDRMAGVGTGASAWYLLSAQPTV